MGVSLLLSTEIVVFANQHGSISKLMGESFKLHGQALIGHEDEVPPVQVDMNGIIDSLPMNGTF